MTTNNPDNWTHPEELLDAYALNALDEEEAIQVESHLEDCLQCRQIVSELQRAITRLGLSVANREPPGALLPRIMDELEPAGAPPAPTNIPVSSIWSRTKVFRVLVPVAASVIVALFALSVVMNLRISDRTGNLERENSTLTAELAKSVAQAEEEESQVAETVQQLRTTNYWLANPTKLSLTLEPPSGSGDSRGVLLISSDGRQAMLLLSDMRKQSPSTTYQVWLMRHGNRWWAGEVEVDEGGWGTATLLPKESVFGFEKVELTAEMDPGESPTADDKVLEADIHEPKPAEKLDFQ